MAELCIQARDERDPADKDYERSLRAGDVIDIQKDGFDWGDLSPQFTIVKAPDVKIEDLEYLVAPIYDTTDRANPILSQPRERRIKLADVKASGKENAMTKADIAANEVAVAVALDAGAIGEEPVP